MIKTLYIKNFILIDELFLEFENGFNVLTGETGAGKSIILKAIDTVMGARVHKDVIFNKEKPGRGSRLCGHRAPVFYGCRKRRYAVERHF